MDYGYEVLAFAMETRAGVHRNLCDGHQPRDGEILQPRGKIPMSLQSERHNLDVHFMSNLLVIGCCPLMCRTFGTL